MKTYQMLTIEENVNFGALTTMKIGGSAKYLTKVKNIEEIKAALDFAREEGVEVFILGGGSNLIVRDEGFDGLVIKNEILGVEQIFEDEESVIFSVGSGENWDKFCRHAVEDRGLSGCEAMVMIPGSVGALPVQNVGAYGQETKAIFEGCEVIDLETGKVEELSREDCRLGYRSSIFREEAIGKYFITRVKLKLFKKKQELPLYFSVAEYFEKNGIDAQNATPLEIMRAVIYLRSEKLPDPSDIPSAGSFFKNVELNEERAQDFKKKFPDGLIFNENGKWKVPTGWLIDQAGLRGKLLHGMRPHDKNALILTNISAKSYADLAAARAEIIKAVREKFGFEIEQEPLEV